MSPMDHAAAHERIEDLLLEPGRLEALEASSAPEDVALRQHLDGCPACRSDLESWRQVQRHVADALPASADAVRDVEPIEVPPSLRTRVLAAVQPGDRPLTAITMDRPARARLRAPWLALAASLVVLVGSAVITLDQVAQRASADAEARALATLVAAVDGVLATDHRIVALRDPNGTAAGSISWSRHDWVVLTDALTQPPSGQLYKCWLEDGDRSVSVGIMEFAGGTAYWVETLDDWATWEIGPNTEFVVSLEASGAQSRSGPIVLSADLGS
jgi:hypothetical protein